MQPRVGFMAGLSFAHSHKFFSHLSRNFFLLVAAPPPQAFKTAISTSVASFSWSLCCF